MTAKYTGILASPSLEEPGGGVIHFQCSDIREFFHSISPDIPEEDIVIEIPSRATAPVLLVKMFFQPHHDRVAHGIRFPVIKGDLRSRGLDFCKLGAFLKAQGIGGDPVICAIPAGGVPVGVELALALSASFFPIIVRKVQIPGNTEAGLGGVSWDGQVALNRRLLSLLDLTQHEAGAALERAKRNVQERVNKFAGGKPLPDFVGTEVVVTDDGLASGYTMIVAVQALRRHIPARVNVAVPTASASAAKLVSQEADDVICLNIRTGPGFAVAEAYRDWYDLSYAEVLDEMARLKQPGK